MLSNNHLKPLKRLENKDVPKRRFFSEETVFYIELAESTVFCIRYYIFTVSRFQW